MKLRTLALALLIPAAGACKDLNRPDLNNPEFPVDGVIENPSRTVVQQLATGLLIGNRVDQAGHIRDLEIIGRDAYNLDNADPRWVTELLGQSDFDPGGFGANHWLARYQNVRNANLMLASLGTASTDIFDAEEISAAEGFAKTIKALDLYYVFETRGTIGFPVEVGATPDDLQPILCRDPALAAIGTLLDEGAADLEAGTDFPFNLPPGFAGFDDPEGFLTFNRAIRAKVAVYQRQFAVALTALGESFLDTTEPLDLGVYHDYGIGAGDVANPLFQANNTFRVHPSVQANSEAGDDRLAKFAVGANRSANADPDIASNLVWVLYPAATTQIPIITNEELILLRAQARIGANDLAGALTDLNFIRVNAGGLGTVGAFANADAAITELLRQKRYSLLFSTGSRWVDHLFYNRLGSLEVEDGYTVHETYPIPQDELNARGGNITCS